MQFVYSTEIGGNLWTCHLQAVTCFWLFKQCTYFEKNNSTLFTSFLLKAKCLNVATKRQARQQKMLRQGHLTKANMQWEKTVFYCLLAFGNHSIAAHLTCLLYLCVCWCKFVGRIKKTCFF